MLAGEGPRTREAVIAAPDPDADKETLRPQVTGLAQWVPLAFLAEALMTRVEIETEVRSFMAQVETRLASGKGDRATIDALVAEMASKFSVDPADEEAAELHRRMVEALREVADVGHYADRIVSPEIGAARPDRKKKTKKGG